MSVRAYLSIVADSDLFGTLSFVCFCVALLGLCGRVRHARLYFPAVFICLLFMPVVHAIGSYFLLKPSP